MRTGPGKLVGLVRKERNYDCFDDRRYNEVDDVEVLAYNVGFVLLQGISKANLRQRL